MVEVWGTGRPDYSPKKVTLVSNDCICPKCGYITSELQPCNLNKCPKCGTTMTTK
jgi:predicted Zn-ribbon and HTH transcriptional regulator